jgi:hypothetical protein
VTGAARLGAFGALLAVVLAGAFAVGRVIDLDAGEASEPPGHGEPAGGHEAAAPHGGAESEGHGEPASPALVAQDGLRLVVDRSTATPGVEEPFAFRIVDGTGAPVEDYDVVHEAEMHLIVARRDLSTYQQLHPTRADDGTWTVPLRLDEPGVYRVFADFTTDGERATLGADIAVAGTFAPAPLPAPAPRATTGPYEVRVATTADGDGETVEFTVLRDGRQVSDLEPYLGAQGHLVALREGDLSFLHVHPIEGEPAPGTVSFAVEYPSAGRYRLFLQFKHDGRVQTVAVTRNVEP